MARTAAQTQAGACDTKAVLAARDKRIEELRQRWLPSAERISKAADLEAYGLNLTVKMAGISPYYYLTDKRRPEFSQSFNVTSYPEADVVATLQAFIRNSKKDLLK